MDRIIANTEYSKDLYTKMLPVTTVTPFQFIISNRSYFAAVETIRTLVKNAIVALDPSQTALFNGTRTVFPLPPSAYDNYLSVLSQNATFYYNSLIGNTGTVSVAFLAITYYIEIIQFGYESQSTGPNVGDIELRRLEVDKLTSINIIFYTL